MNEQPDPNVPSPEPNNSEPHTENDEVEASTRTNSIDDLIKSVIGKDKTKNFNEFFRGLGAASVYIDARSGGAYFAEQVDITGDVIGGDQTKWATVSAKRSSLKEVAGQVLSTDIQKVYDVYIETQSYTHAKSILEKNNLLILCGNSRFGKRTTAIHLLLYYLRNARNEPKDGTENIFEINPSLEDISSFQCDINQGYVIDTIALDSAAKINNYVLNRLSQQMRKKDSYLVITVDSSARLSKDSLDGYILNWSELPHNEALLEKHLQWYLKEPGITNSDLTITQVESVRELLNNQLLPGDIDRLAELLAKVVSEQLTLENALARFSVLANQQVESWFDKHPDLSQRTFMISLAVLNGSKYQEVVDSSQRLQSAIKPPSDKEEDSLPESKRSQRLKEYCAHLVQGSENTEYGISAVELIVLDNPTFQPAVLSHIWEEYDRYRHPLLEWLYELGSHSNFQIQIRASAAVGELSKYAFGLVKEKVLLPWANSQEQRLQRLAALVLSIPVFEGELAPQVLKLLHHWSTLPNNPRLRWTATVAYGGYVGLRFPDVALRDLFAIAQSEDPVLFSAVVESVVSLFEAGQLLFSQYFIILDALETWTEYPKTTAAHQLGLIIFLELMRESKVSAGSNSEYWPTLLWLAKENQVYEDIVTSLLRRALNMKLIRISVLEEIHNWLKLVDYDQRLYSTLGRIIYTLVIQGTERERERIGGYLKRWASVEQPNAASKILSVIRKYLSL
ncbi:hypothetical protein ACE1CI_01535 [Aerosakkonemataceae cyanobacterium BLCC-F50]|uniref:Novel STAND NTPase 3 domain-containing protein n=1 Tax=Floridaenema flaviceps BLCC-F50 TaxID=3153642 RepID=A0ABV4XK40_9CYAN